MQLQKNLLLDQFNETRARTLELVKPLEIDDYLIQSAPYTSPPKWHLGHVTWIYEVILDRLTEYEFYSKELSEYLNSYYQQFGTPHDKDKRGISSRPALDQIQEYFGIINNRITKFLTDTKLDDNAVNIFTMGMHHECQHQELLVYDLQHLLADRYEPITKNAPPKTIPIQQDMMDIKGGLYHLGNSDSKFCYDIELPEHKVYLQDYKIDAFPVTNKQYLEFINDKGYERFEFWLADGWDKVKENNWNSPMYWTRKDDTWMIHDFAGVHEINQNKPVCHVSYYEADAYSKWAKKRLPTEAEWEKAACWNDTTMTKMAYPWGDDPPSEKNCNTLESYLWESADIGAYPQGKSASGCNQMIGDVWEWTSSEFEKYPGFQSGFSEYNDKWFTNQKVLRGGSFATPKMSIRTSYRNFFRLDERWLFSGFRCASDI